jgi:hypothetical protein
MYEKTLRTQKKLREYENIEVNDEEFFYASDLIFF